MGASRKGECSSGDCRGREVFGTRHGKEGLARRRDAGFGGPLAKRALEGSEKRETGLCKGGGGGSSAEQLGTPGALLGSQQALGPPEEHKVAPSLRPEGLG